MRRDEWRGCVVHRKDRATLSIKYRLDGRWVMRATPFRVGEERKAEAALAALRDRLLAREAEGLPAGAVTVRAWSVRWLADRERDGVADAPQDRNRLDTHVLPAIGDMALDDVRPRHLLEIVDSIRALGRAPRTVRNVYGTIRAMWRDARIADLTNNAPCILGAQQIGRVRDADPLWRDRAQLSHAELCRLCLDEQVTGERRLMWGLMSLAFLRHGEVAGLRWRALDLDAEPLGRIDVSTSYDLGRTKGRRSRRVPVHPSLRPLLAAWRMTGWRERYGRQPTPDDLVLPRPTDATRPRAHQGTYRLLQLDLARLGMPPRRAHDLRRTGITLALDAGADEARLKWATHGRPGTVMGGYTSRDWRTICEEVARIPALTANRPTVVPLPAAGGLSKGEPATHPRVTSRK